MQVKMLKANYLHLRVASFLDCHVTSLFAQSVSERYVGKRQSVDNIRLLHDPNLEQRTWQACVVVAFQVGLPGIYGVLVFLEGYRSICVEECSAVPEPQV